MAFGVPGWCGTCVYGWSWWFQVRKLALRDGRPWHSRTECLLELGPESGDGKGVLSRYDMLSQRMKLA